MAAKPKYKYQPYQQDVILLKGIEDIYPYELHLPDLPPLETIVNYGKHPSEQLFQRVVVPKEIKALNLLPREDAIRIAENDPEISAFIARMWYHFEYGEFQFINGEPLYISPTYWFYLNFWHLDTGLPKFRYDKTHYCTDLWEFAWWDLVVQPSPICYGEIQGTKRKIGKTYKAMCKAFKRVISRREAMGVLQSKTDDDAKDAFNVKMVRPVLKLPFFFIPFQANSTIPKAEGYRFEPRSKKGAGHVAIDPDEYLFSSFEYRASGESACDGPKWYVHVTDEDGKCPNVDVNERWAVNKPALTEEDMIIGKEITTTTVEDMEGGGGEGFCRKWLRSDRNPNRKKEDLTVDEDGKTSSGLWQWFCPSRTGEVWDKFGLAIIDDPTPEQQQWLRDVRKDIQWRKGGRQRVRERIANQKTQRDKHSEMRKFPEEVRDMFIAANGFCHFDREILETRAKYFWNGYPAEVRDKMAFINFHWIDGIKFGKVGFTHAYGPEEAKFWLSYIPREELRNKSIKHPVNEKKSPANWDKFVSGADPYKFDTEEVLNKDKMSTAAMHIYAEYDPVVDSPNVDSSQWVTNDIIGEYFWRKDQSVEEMCEDYAMACIFFGMKVFPEKNNKDVITYFKQNGLENYLQFDMKIAKGEGGLYMKETSAGSNTDVANIQSMFKVVQKYVKEKGHRCMFPRTIDQLLKVSPKNMTDYDLFVSLAKCLQVVMDFNPMREDEDEGNDIGDIIGAIHGTAASGGGGSFGDDAPGWTG